MPVADHERRDLVYWRAAEIGQQFFCNKVLLIFPGGGAQPGFTIRHIQLYQGREGQKAVSVNAAVQGQQGNNTFEINVDMNPVIKIEGGNMDEEKVFEVMKNRIREMADDLGDEIAERMSKIFANMPLVQEA